MIFMQTADRPHKLTALLLAAALAYSVAAQGAEPKIGVVNVGQAAR